MNRRHFVKSLAGAGAALATAQAFGQAPAAVRRRPPNILLIMSDQERERADLPGGLGLNAHDWIAQRGMSFSNFNVNTTPCSPSRSNIYTGQHTQFTGMTTNVGAPPFPEMK